MSEPGQFSDGVSRDPFYNGPQPAQQHPQYQQPQFGGQEFPTQQFPTQQFQPQAGWAQPHLGNGAPQLPQRQWFKKKRVIIPAAVLALGVVASAANGGSDNGPA